MAAHVSHEEKKRLYFKVFFALFVITILEVAATFLPGHKLIRDTIICLFACTKAGAVGYWYMHLNHETKWLRIVAIMPMIILLYVAVLIPDTMHSRPTATYLPIRPRVFPEAHHEEHAEAEESETEVEADLAAPAEEVHATAAAPQAAAPTATESAPSAAAHPPEAVTPPPAAAPAAGGGGSADEWR